MPFDCVPIIIPQTKWAMIEAGVKQRVQALNLFLQDVYGQQRIIRDGFIPRQLVENNPYFTATMMGFQVPIANHIFLAGIDLIRDEKGDYHVLEDNLRNPSGISYVFENRDVMKEVYPEFFSKHTIQPLDKHIAYMKKHFLCTAHLPCKQRESLKPCY